MRHLRRFVTVCALASLAAAAPSAAQAQVLFTDAFTRANSSTVGNGWVETESAGNDATINTNRLVFVINNTLNVPRVQHTFSAVSSGLLRFAFTMDWARTSGTENLYSVFMQLGNSSTLGAPPADGSSVAGAAINLRWGDDNWGFTTEEGFGYVNGTTQTQVMTLSGLHTVEVIADLSTQTYSISVDGSTVASGVAFDKSLAAIGGSIDAVRFYQGEGISTGAGGNTAFDDVTIEVVTCGAASLPFTDNFNRANSSTVGNCWTETESAGNDATINTNRLVFVTNDVDAVPLVQRTLSPVSSGYLRWTFALDWARGGAENLYSVFMQLGNSGTFGTPPADGASVPGAAINLRWGDDNFGFPNEEGFGYVRGTTQTQVTTVTGLHTVEVIANLNAQTYTIKVDGATVATGIAFDKSLAAIGGSINAVRIYQGEGIGAGAGGNKAFDDVSIQTITYAVNVTPNGLAYPVVRRAGTGYRQDLTVTNNSTLSEDFDLLAWTAPGASFLTVDSITGASITRGARADSARLSGLGSGASGTASLWYTVATSTDDRVDTLYLRARSVFDATVRDDGWAQVKFDSPAALLGRYWLREAPSGQSPDSVFDDQASPVNADLIYDTPVAWALISGHRAVRATSASHLGIARRSVVGTKYVTNLDGETRASFVTVASWQDPPYVQRLAGFENTSNVRPAMIETGGNGAIEFRFRTKAQTGVTVRWGIYIDDVRRVFHVVYDADDATNNRRVRLYLNGVDQGAGSLIAGAWPAQGEQLDFAVANLELHMLNRTDLTTGLIGSLYYYAVYDGMLTDAEISSNASALAADDDNITLAVNVTLDGVDTLPRVPSNGTSYSYKFTVSNTGTVQEDFDLLAFPGDTAATFVAVDSITGFNVTRGARADSARMSGLAAGGSDSAFAWFSVTNVPPALDSLYLRGRSVTNGGINNTGWVFVRLVKPALSTSKSVNPSGTQLPGTELTYTMTFTNGGTADAANVTIVDSLATQVQFKVGSVVSNLPAGVTAVVEYSNDGGASWTYTPVSGGCSAPVNFDGCVNRVRWTFQNPLSSGAPNNTGDVRLVARIK